MSLSAMFVPRDIKVRQFRRSDRVSEQILRDVSEFVMAELADDIPGMVTFTHVKLSKDLRYATVFYSYLDKEQNYSRIQAYLESKKGMIRKHIGKGLRMRHIPEFAFKFDEAVETGIRIGQLLEELKNEPGHSES